MKQIVILSQSLVFFDEYEENTITAEKFKLLKDAWKSRDKKESAVTKRTDN